jgi:hypothetical protein
MRGHDHCAAAFNLTLVAHYSHRLVGFNLFQTIFAAENELGSVAIKLTVSLIAWTNFDEDN